MAWYVYKNSSLASKNTCLSLYSNYTHDISTSSGSLELDYLKGTKFEQTKIQHDMFMNTEDNFFHD